MWTDGSKFAEQLLLALFFFKCCFYKTQISKKSKIFFIAISLCFQRLAIELFRRQTSRSSSPPDMRLTTGTTASERDPRSVKSDDDVQTSLSNTKKGDEEERTQHDDSNVSTGHIRRKIITIATIEISALFYFCRGKLWCCRRFKRAHVTITLAYVI